MQLLQGVLRMRGIEASGLAIIWRETALGTELPEVTHQEQNNKKRKMPSRIEPSAPPAQPPPGQPPLAPYPQPGHPPLPLPLPPHVPVS